MEEYVKGQVERDARRQNEAKNPNSVFIMLMAPAILAALIGALADTLLLYNPQGGYEKSDFLFLQSISPERLIWGSLLGIFFIPFEVLGLLGVYINLETNGPSWRKMRILLLGVYFPYVGVAVHGLFGAFGLALHYTQDPVLIQHFQSLMNPVAGAAFILHALISILAGRELMNTPNFPRWAVLFNPLMLYLFMASAYWIVPSIGTALFPAAFNLSYALFFTFCLFWFTRKK